MKKAVASIVVLLVLGFSDRASADSFYAHVVGCCQTTSSSPVNLNRGVVKVDAFTGQAGASAGPGTLGGFSQAAYDYTSGTQGGGSNAAQEDSSFSLTGIHITGPAGVTDHITVYFNIAVSGSIGAAAMTDFGAQASVGLSYGVGSSLGGTSGDLGSMTVDTGGGVTRSGIFNNFAVGTSDKASSSEPSVVTFAGDTLYFNLHLSSYALVYKGFQTGPGTANAFADFYHTAGFDPSKPVLILPDGYSAYSDDGSIVNNRLVPTPEPDTLLLLATGLFGLGGMYRRAKPARKP